MSGYALVIALFLLGRWKFKRQEIKKADKKNAASISVIVPFRNEVGNLKSLVESINGLSAHAEEYIFVNDHSEDESLLELENLSVPFTVLELKSESGKKKAIAFGVENAQSKFILTWDADVVVPPDYFEELRKNPWSDLVILPVKMLGSDFIPGFFAMDYQLQTQANVSLAGFYRPITASGANLLFKKSVFLEVQTFRKDGSVSSGDDQFLLKACRKSGKEITLLTNQNVRVETSAPESIRDGMEQRWRWLGKSRFVQDHFASVFGLLTFLIQMSYYSFAWYQLIIGDYGATIVMILIKGELDAFLSTYKFQEQFNTLNVFLYQVIYPFYMIALLFGAFTTTLTWKGRKI